MPKFIHICQDEKFINSGFSQFEELYPGDNLLYIYGCKNRDLKYIKVSSSKIYFIEINSTFFESLDSDSIVVFHSLPDYILPFLNSIHLNIPIIWFLFGFETYSDGSLYDKLNEYDSLTFSLIYPNYKKEKIKNLGKNILFPIIRSVKKDWRFSDNELRKKKKEHKISLLQRVDFLGCSFNEEYQFQKKLLNLDSPFFDFWYYPLEKIVNTETAIVENKHKIMIGHSGFPNGNHLDIVNKISKYQFYNSELIVPFSYGDENYMKSVKPLLINLKSDLIFIEEFMPLDKYNMILQDVKVAIFNNRRQQAIGNIVALVYMGAKVFLSKRNTFYHFLVRNNVNIYCYENHLNQESITEGLTKEEIYHNRKILLSLMRSSKLKEELNDSIMKVLKNN